MESTLKTIIDFGFPMNSTLMFKVDFTVFASFKGVFIVAIKFYFALNLSYKKSMWYDWTLVLLSLMGFSLPS